MDRYLRVFKFMFQVWGMALKNKTLFTPILFNIVVAVPIMFALSFALSIVTSEAASFTLLGLGLTLLYFIDYLCAGLTASLIHDEVTEGNAQMDVAAGRVKQAAGGILMFAAISAALDMLTSYAQERSDFVGKAITMVLYAVWTTATFVVLPGMVIEGLSFGQAFGRSKEIMSNDPTQVGVGVVGIAAVNYLLGFVTFGLAYKVMGPLGQIHPIVGAMGFFTLVNLYWALSGYLKTSYFTCFYLWASECERRQSSDVRLAPAPLAAALGA